eukprot:735-Lingulodinium_polyedra.AAC.1
MHPGLAPARRISVSAAPCPTHPAQRRDALGPGSDAAAPRDGPGPGAWLAQELSQKLAQKPAQGP